MPFCFSPFVCGTEDFIQAHCLPSQIPRTQIPCERQCFPNHGPGRIILLLEKHFNFMLSVSIKPMSYFKICLQSCTMWAKFILKCRILLTYNFMELLKCCVLDSTYLKLDPQSNRKYFHNSPFMYAELISKGFSPSLMIIEQKEILLLSQIIA